MSEILPFAGFLQQSTQVQRQQSDVKAAVMLYSSKNIGMFATLGYDPAFTKSAIFL